MFKRFFKIGILAALAMILAIPAVSMAGPCDKWPAKLRLGVIPVEGGADTVERFKPVTDQLTKILGIPVETVSASDYAGVITAMAHNNIEFAYFGPKSYTDAAEKANAQAMVAEMDANGNPGYYGIIITRKDSGITTMEQAKGKQFAFTDPNSTSGFLVPNVLFARDMKVKPQDYFKEVKFSGSHGASIVGVHKGTIEVASTNNIDLQRAIEKGVCSKDDFNVLWTSDLIPGAPMCARSDLPETLKAAFAGALMQLNGDKASLEKLGIGGYAYTDDKVYDIIRYLKKLKKELQAKQ
jgi:phosphonate transport system substrate-binding protein